MRVNMQAEELGRQEIASWGDALRDAERQLAEAKARVRSLASAVRVCRERVNAGEPWPCADGQR